MTVTSVAQATIIRFVTTSGNIDVRLYDSATPIHVANILAYINSNRYDGTIIHRSAKNQDGSSFVIQGGGYKINTSLYQDPLPSGWSAIPTFGTVQNEPGISNLRGTLALAKSSGISSGTSQWFINMSDSNTFLDQPAPTSNQFTVFGRLIRNTISVADAIAGLSIVNASSSGGPFNELPVRNLQTVINKQDVDNTDAVVVNDVVVLNFAKGDYNFDGKVDVNDYNVWSNNFGSTTAAEADGNGNGKVDLADFTVWRDSFGQTGGSGSGAATAVPEPASFVLSSMAAAVLIFLGWRHGGRP